MSWVYKGCVCVCVCVCVPPSQLHPQNLTHMPLALTRYTLYSPDDDADPLLHRRVLLELSNGGADATVVREFDLRTKVPPLPLASLSLPMPLPLASFSMRTKVPPPRAPPSSPAVLKPTRPLLPHGRRLCRRASKALRSTRPSSACSGRTPTPCWSART